MTTNISMHQICALLDKDHDVEGLTCHYDLQGERIEHKSGEVILSPWGYVPPDGESPLLSGSSEPPSIVRSAY